MFWNRPAALERGDDIAPQTDRRMAQVAGIKKKTKKMKKRNDKKQRKKGTLLNLYQILHVRLQTLQQHGKQGKVTNYKMKCKGKENIYQKYLLLYSLVSHTY